jgi:hypothetical protein
MERPLHWLKAQVHMEPTASSIANDKWPVSIDLTHHGRKGGKKAPHRIAGEVGGTDLCSGVRHLKILCDNDCDQRLATIDELYRRILSRVRCIAWLELRCQHRQANASLDPHSRKVMSGPAAINGIRHYAGRSGRAPGRSNNCEDLSGLGDKASDSKAQEKSAIGRTELRHTQRPIRLNTKNTARGFGK